MTKIDDTRAAARAANARPIDEDADGHMLPRSATGDDPLTRAAKALVGRQRRRTRTPELALGPEGPHVGARLAEGFALMEDQ